MAYFWNPELDKERRLRDTPPRNVTPVMRPEEMHLPSHLRGNASVRDAERMKALQRARAIRKRKRQGPR